MSRQAFIAWNSSAPIFGAPGTPSINAAASWYCQLRQVREPQPEKTALAITALAASPVGYMGSRSHKTISTSEKVWTLPASRSIGRVRLPWWSSSLSNQQKPKPFREHTRLCRSEGSLTDIVSKHVQAFATRCIWQACKRSRWPAAAETVANAMTRPFFFACVDKDNAGS